MKNNLDSTAQNYSLPFANRIRTLSFAARLAFDSNLTPELKSLIDELIDQSIEETEKANILPETVDDTKLVIHGLN